MASSSRFLPRGKDDTGVVEAISDEVSSLVRSFLGWGRKRVTQASSASADYLGLSNYSKLHTNRFAELGITGKEFRALLKIFAKCDVDSNGKLDLIEFMEEFNVKSNFIKRAFQIFDKDKSDYLDIDEFVLGVWNYCTLDQNSLIAFTFDVCDVNGLGMLRIDTIEKLVLDLFGDDTKSKNAKRILKKTKERLKRADKDQEMYESHARRFGSNWMPKANESGQIIGYFRPETGEFRKTIPDEGEEVGGTTNSSNSNSNGDSSSNSSSSSNGDAAKDAGNKGQGKLRIFGDEMYMLTPDKFHQIVREHPILLYPARSLQFELQRKTVGMAFWKRTTKLRQFLQRKRFQSDRIGAYETWLGVHEMLRRMKEHHTTQTEVTKRLQEQYDTMQAINRAKAFATSSSSDVAKSDDEESATTGDVKTSENSLSSSRERGSALPSRRTLTARVFASYSEARANVKTAFLASASASYLLIVNAALLAAGVLGVLFRTSLFSKDWITEEATPIAEIALVVFGATLVAVGTTGCYGVSRQIRYNREAMKNGGADYSRYVGERKSCALFVWILAVGLLVVLLLASTMQVYLIRSGGIDEEAYYRNETDCRVRAQTIVASDPCVDNITNASAADFDFFSALLSIASLVAVVTLVLAIQLRFYGMFCSMERVFNCIAECYRRRSGRGSSRVSPTDGNTEKSNGDDTQKKSGESKRPAQANEAEGSERGDVESTDGFV